MNKTINRLKEYYDFTKRKFRSQETDKLNNVVFLLKKYCSMLPPTQKEAFRAEEYRAYSQNGEDGILLYIFSKIGTTNKTTIEFGVGNGNQCNSANLIQNFGWNGLFMEGNAADVESGKRYYKNKGVSNLKFVNAFITKENINELIQSNGYSGEIDLLNVDIDGNDYWVWQAIDVIQPRVVVVEYNSSFGKEKSVSVPYEPTFNRWEKHSSGWYHGASLKAFEKLGKEKGYKLVACDSSGVNAFFVLSSLDAFESISAVEAYYTEYKRVDRSNNFNDQFDTLTGLPLTEV
jgi:hypothetical protein